MKLDKKKRTIAVSVLIAIILVSVGMVSGNATIMGNFLLGAIVIIVFPIFFFQYSYYRWLKNIEGQFPNFVRDLADSRRSGMSFPESIRLGTRAHYKKLSAEVHHMNNKLSMGIPFERVLDMFQKRMKDSKIITESITIIKESYLSGGNVAATLDAIARDIIMLKDTESERVSMMKQNVMIMYAIFFMFLGICVMIIFVMIPMIDTQPTVQTGSFGFSFNDPCEGFSFFPCNLLGAIGFFLAAPPGIASYYISIFFMVVLIQGIFSGLIAGQLGQNSAVAGVKHSMIMALSGIGIFIFLARTGLFPT